MEQLLNLLTDWQTNNWLHTSIHYHMDKQLKTQSSLSQTCACQLRKVNKFVCFSRPVHSRVNEHGRLTFRQIAYVSFTSEQWSLRKTDILQCVFQQNTWTAEVNTPGQLALADTAGSCLFVCLVDFIVVVCLFVCLVKQRFVSFVRK